MAGFSDTTERKFDTTTRAIIVDEDLAGFQRFGEAHLARAILCPDACHKAEVRAVGNCDGLSFIFERDDNLDGAEDFLLCERMVWI